jgi:flagellar basal body-associated protein FliL
MTDEIQVPSEKKGIAKKLLPVIGVVVVAAAGAVAVYLFVLSPRLNPQAEGEETIPQDAQWLELEEGVVSIEREDADIPASTLLYQVSLHCANEKTVGLIQEDMPWFLNMIRRLHSNRTREEVDDPLVVESIEKQALAKANNRLEQLQEAPEEDVRVIEVIHKKFVVTDI